MIIIDGFLDDFDSVRDYVEKLDYTGAVNPDDGVTYPDISLDIPPRLMGEVIHGIREATGKRTSNVKIFLRLSTFGVDAPHQAHTDTIMGSSALMLYLNKADDCQGGTAFVKHKATGLDSNPVNETEEIVWRTDVNNYDAWEQTSICEMKENRALIFDANTMHRAEPVGGFGSDANDGRLVLTAFFDLEAA